MKRIFGIYHYLIAFSAKLLYRSPSRRLLVIGVTGTKGKSSVVELINAGLEKAGRETALISTLRIKIGRSSRRKATGNSMPGRGLLQWFLKEAVEAGCEAAIIEVTSQGIAQSRALGIDFDVALITNLQPEHLESHGGFENYKKAKLAFFKLAAKNSAKEKKYFFVNASDPYAEEFAKAAEGNPVIRYAPSSLAPQLPGKFYRENVGAAVAVLKTLGVEERVIAEAMNGFSGVPGRAEFIQKEPFSVVIDYAHTPDSLKAIYEAVRETTKGDIIGVLGAAGGGRDKWKRPEMGKVAADYCKRIILTNEDPYDEDPEVIVAEIKKGIKKNVPVEEIVDRGEAIERAIFLARPGDAVVITGKGAERLIHVKNGQTIPWSDKEEIEKILGRFSS
ncbi:MAG TPA: Mur ligase family protein [Candidatus Tyrphobacter sp.]|nr:Mur ligase family protein [Candidatus Tyrphobacter sp.]